LTRTRKTCVKQAWSHIAVSGKRSRTAANTLVMTAVGRSRSIATVTTSRVTTMTNHWTHTCSQSLVSIYSLLFSISISIKGKRYCIALLRNPSQRYWASPAMWDHTALPATRHRSTRPTLTPARQAGTRFTYPCP